MFSTTSYILLKFLGKQRKNNIFLLCVSTVEVVLNLLMERFDTAMAHAQNILLRSIY